MSRKGDYAKARRNDVAREITRANRLAKQTTRRLTRRGATREATPTSKQRADLERLSSELGQDTPAASSTYRGAALLVESLQRKADTRRRQAARETERPDGEPRS